MYYFLLFQITSGLSRFINTDESGRIDASYLDDELLKGNLLSLCIRKQYTIWAPRDGKEFVHWTELIKRVISNIKMIDIPAYCVSECFLRGTFDQITCHFTREGRWETNILDVFFRSTSKLYLNFQHLEPGYFKLSSQYFENCRDLTLSIFLFAGSRDVVPERPFVEYLIGCLPKNKLNRLIITDPTLYNLDLTEFTQLEELQFANERYSDIIKLPESLVKLHGYYKFPYQKIEHKPNLKVFHWYNFDLREGLRFIYLNPQIRDCELNKKKYYQGRFYFNVIAFLGCRKCFPIEIVNMIFQNLR